MKPEDVLRNLLPSLAEREGIEALLRLLQLTMLDTQDRLGKVLEGQAALPSMLEANRQTPAVNVAAPEVIVSPVLQSAPGSSWEVKGKDGNGRAFSFTVTKKDSA